MSSTLKALGPIPAPQKENKRRKDKFFLPGRLGGGWNGGWRALLCTISLKDVVRVTERPRETPSHQRVGFCSVSLFALSYAARPLMGNQRDRALLHRTPFHNSQLLCFKCERSPTRLWLLNPWCSTAGDTWGGLGLGGSCHYQLASLFLLPHPVASLQDSLPSWSLTLWNHKPR